MKVKSELQGPAREAAISAGNEAVTGFPCPECGLRTAVTDSRQSENKKAVRRRRVCQHCEHRFTTYELAGNMRQAFRLKSTPEFLKFRQQLQTAIFHALGTIIEEELIKFIEESLGDEQ